MTNKVISSGIVRYCPLCGGNLTEALKEGRKRLYCSSCRWVHYLNPVPAAACLALNDSNEVLLIKRAVEPQKGKWSLPAGFIEIDETSEEAALRELQEETGLKGKIIHLIGVYSQPSSNYKSVLTVGYRINIEGGRLQAGDDAEGVKFKKLKDISNIPFISHRRMLEEELKYEK